MDIYWSDASGTLVSKVVQGWGHLHVVRNYYINFTDGTMLELPAKLIEGIVAHERADLHPLRALGKCQNPRCDKPVMGHRKSKRFCSHNCRVATWLRDHRPSRAKLPAPLTG